MGGDRGGHSRRTVLGAVLAVVGAVPLAGCDSLRQAPRERPAPDPLNPFYLDTLALARRYDATITAVPGLAERLGPLRDAHHAHAQALVREMGPGLNQPSATPSETAPADQTAALAALLAAEKEASAAARETCLTAPSYRAALLGSIAAARASHVEALS
ncbi:hypothetical protein HC030_04015 [Planosporangium mesophilum]|nr:hypothetical protein [Planosporangium mesophilum]NJC81732.1 hypothetical protein [Planosporangium mesophilum]